MRARDYCVEIDIAGEPTNEAAVAQLRRDLQDTTIKVKVLKLVGPGGGNPNLLLYSSHKQDLVAWLTMEGYDPEVHPIVRYDQMPGARRLTISRAPGSKTVTVKGAGFSPRVRRVDLPLTATEATALSRLLGEAIDGLVSDADWEGHQELRWIGERLARLRHEEIERFTAQRK